MFIIVYNLHNQLTIIRLQQLCTTRQGRYSTSTKIPFTDPVTDTIPS